jgi:hypothetical protein
MFINEDFTQSVRFPDPEKPRKTKSESVLGNDSDATDSELDESDIAEMCTLVNEDNEDFSIQKDVLDKTNAMESTVSDLTEGDDFNKSSSLFEIDESPKNLSQNSKSLKRKQDDNEESEIKKSRKSTGK